MTSAILRNSASSGILNSKPGHSDKSHDKHGRHGAKDEAAETDPILAVLNRHWSKKAKDEPKQDAAGLAGAGDTGRRNSSPASPVPAKKPGDRRASGRPRMGGGSLTVDTSPTKHPGMDFGDMSPKLEPAKAPRRFTTSIEVACGAFSPRFKSCAVRRPNCKLDFVEQTAGDDVPEEEKAESDFNNIANKIQGWTGQWNMQMQGLMEVVKKRHAENPEVLDSNPPNMEKMRDVVGCIATASYHVNKWLHQLDPAKEEAPRRPTAVEEELGVAELFAEMQFGISKLDKVANTLGIALLKIVSDTKNMRRTADGHPIAPGAKRASIQAGNRGLKDPSSLSGYVGNLEYTLDLMQSLAYRPAQVKSMGAAIKVLIAANRFKKNMFKKKAASKEAA